MSEHGSEMADWKDDGRFFCKTEIQVPREPIPLQGAINRLTHAIVLQITIA